MALIIITSNSSVHKQLGKKKSIYINASIFCQVSKTHQFLYLPLSVFIAMSSKLLLFSVLVIVGSMLVQCCHGLRLNGGGRTLTMKSRNLWSLTPSDRKDEEKIPQQYGPFTINMPLDHFAGDNTTFKNRYWVNTDYYKPNGPILCK